MRLARHVPARDDEGGGDLVGLPTQSPQHLRCVRVVARLAVERLAQVHHRVGDHEPRIGTLARGVPLGGRHSLHVVERRLSGPPRLVDVHRAHLEGQAELLEELSSTRRGAREHERHSALAARRTYVRATCSGSRERHLASSVTKPRMYTVAGRFA